jgi:hypothetical protein
MSGATANPLQQIPLRDIHLPDAVSWWPPAYGWWLLALVLGVLVWMAWRLARSWPARRSLAQVRERALKELETVEARYQAAGDARAAVAAMSVVLRRVALSLAPREEVAALTGERWLRWLAQRCDAPDFPVAGRVLAHAPYQPDPHVDVRTLLTACRAFVGSVAEGRVRA